MKRSQRKFILFSTLFSLLLFSSLLYPQTRELSVKVLADEEFRQDPNWQQKAESILSSASEEFEKLFGTKFVIKKFEGWDSNDSLNSLELLAEDLESRISKENLDVLIVFTSQKNLDKRFLGCSRFQEGIVLVKKSENSSDFLKALKHELGHLFGAVHVDSPGSLMDTFVRGDHFDPLNSSLILLYKKRAFNTSDFPLDKENMSAAIEIYKKICTSIQYTQIKMGTDFSEKSESLKNSHLEDVNIFLAQIYVEKREYDHAISECQKALRINPQNPEALNLSGIALRKKGLVAEAIKKYNQVLKIKPNYVKTFYNLGIAYSKEGDMEASLSAYKRAIELKPNFAEAHSNLGDAYLRIGKIEEAEQEFLKAISISPQFALAHSNLAETRLRKKDYPQALAEVEKAISLNPQLPGPYNVRGNLYYREGKVDLARDEYRKALSLDPNYEKAYYNLGVIDLEQNQVQEAKEYFKKAVQTSQNFAEAHASLGYCLLSEGKLDEAIEEINLALKLGDKSPKAHLNLSYAYLRKGNLDQAIFEAKKTIELDPFLAAAYNNLGIAYVQKGMMKEAVEQFKKALEADPRNKEGYANLGSLYLHLEMLDQALEIYLKGIQIDPKNAIIHNNMAVIYFKKGEYELAWEHVRKAESLGFEVNPEFLKELKRKIASRQSMASAPRCFLINPIF